MTSKFLASLCFAFVVSGCEVPVIIAAENAGGAMTGAFEVTLPAKLFIKLENGDEELLVGELRGHASGSAEYDFEGPVNGKCSGAAQKRGKTTMECTSGFSMSIDTPEQRSSMSGLNVLKGEERGMGYVSAMGWGKQADETLLRAAVKNAQ